MKLPLLLSQYLREHHKLSLPGIGHFHHSGPAASDAEASAQPANIHFEHKPVIEPDERLLEFIKQKTGKIRPLALADLDCYIENGLQLLNIGKPFYIEGIGTIQKTREGKYDFAAREIHASKLEEPISDRSITNDKKQHSKSVFDDEKYTPGVNPWQKIVVAFLILGGLAIVVFGGYYLYNQNNSDATRMDDPAPNLVDTVSIKKDTLSVPQTDTAQTLATYAANTNAGTFKFVLETTNSKKRALKRYNQLKWTSLKMETVDSSLFKLYFIIPATAKDTARIKDSLNRYYTSKVQIEM